ncbi:MAG: branched-chain amino acid aminotransferase [Syntrophorhabdales bacterium]|jgi:branched-chain amino acid aminotransferase
MENTFGRRLDTEIVQASQSRLGQVDFDALAFGRIFSDHMFMADYCDGSWQSPRIVPFGNIEIPPSLCCLHYGQAVFEGLKAFRSQNNGITLFRPDKYQQRFNRSGSRLCIPPVSRELFMEAIAGLCRIDREWVPEKRGSSLYIRPFIFAADSFLGVHAAETYLFIVITSPVAAYYAEGLDPVSLVTSGPYARAVKGGLGEAKTPANYAASLLPAEKAQTDGFTQVLWLDAIEKRYIEEVGTMNIMFLIDGELITPPLDGSILGGITRYSVLELAAHWGVPVREERITIDDLFARAADGGLQEVFGTGTAAVISPVGWIRHGDKTITINEGRIGAFSQRLYDEITAIQYGERPDLFGWCHPV